MFPFAGPFFWLKSGTETVFRITIRDDTGVSRNGWVLCGNWWGRITPRDIEVRWDTNKIQPMI